MPKRTVSVTLFTALLLACLLTLCACSGGGETPPKETNTAYPQETTPPQDDSPLDLELKVTDGDKIQDIAVDGDGTLYFLLEDGDIRVYAPDGTPKAEYKLELAQQGLTAYRIACKDGTLYLLDGHNNGIITVEAGQVSRFSSVTFSDVASSRQFCVGEDGLPLSSFAGLDQPYVAAVDPSGETAELVSKQPGYLIDENTTYLPELVYSETDANRLKVTLYEGENAVDEFYLAPAEDGRSMVGLSVYGRQDGGIVGLIHEFVNPTGKPEDEVYLQTPVWIDPQSGTFQTTESRFGEEETVVLSAMGTYGMRRSGDTVTIKPTGDCFTGWQPSEAYLLER